MASMRIAVLLLASIGSVVMADPIRIANTDRVANMDPGCCAWACLETQAKHLGISALYGITSRKSRSATSGGTPERIHAELRRFDLPYSIQNDGNYDIGLLRQSLADGRSVSVSLWNYPEAGDRHAVLLTELTQTSIRFIDPNDKSEKTASRSWFLHHWTGRAVSLHRPTKIGTSLPVLANPVQYVPLRYGACVYLSPTIDSQSLRKAIRSGPRACQSYLRDRLGYTEEAAAQTARLLTGHSNGGLDRVFAYR